MPTTVQILNAIRNDPTSEYASVIPEATRDNIAAIGNAILNYVPNANVFAATLLNKIGKTIISDKMAVNQFKPFKKGTLPFGDTIEDIFVEIAESEGFFDNTGANPLGFRSAGVKVLYHSENYKGKFVKSLSDEQVKAAFTTQEGVSTLLGAIVNSLYSGDEREEYIIMKKVLADYAAKYATYECSEISDEATARTFLRSVRKAVLDMSFLSENYNYAGVLTKCDPEDLVLFVNKDVLAHTDVDVISKTFNIGKADFQPLVVPLDDFSTMPNTLGILADKDFLFMYDTEFSSEQIRNPDGKFTNHFLHHWEVLSLSHFRNALRFQMVSDAIPVITTAAIAAGNNKAFAGTCKAGSTVEVWKDGVKLDDAVVVDDDWSYTIAVAAAGEVYTAKATSGGNVYWANTSKTVTA